MSYQNTAVLPRRKLHYHATLLVDKQDLVRACCIDNVNASIVLKLINVHLSDRGKSIDAHDGAVVQRRIFSHRKLPVLAKGDQAVV